ncbi:hypothetical protein F993_01923 [Acinetobacter proteolyticus]|uniref:Uncharacterized protein n=1 Tax=Acinetobacter proteolyticus TaxID=1776741 RepID=A0ABN0JF03_9GAMM|nr:hypothetical protein [Acinetobacter proteolyticus]ENU23769.1 hypothetical protein F993_01923 [Acinetobacter proteolyticus]
MNHVLDETPTNLNYQLGNKQFRLLRIISIISLLFMLWHDLDHLRVVMHRSYSIVPQQFVTVFIAYVPAIAAFYMAYKRSAYAALTGLIAGILLLMGFFLLHIIGTSAISPIFDSFLGAWKVPFAALHSDLFSWLNLIANMVWSVVMIMLSFHFLAAQLTGRLKV